MTEIEEILRESARLKAEIDRNQARRDAWKARLEARADEIFQAACPRITMTRQWSTVATGVDWYIGSQGNGHWDPILNVLGVLDDIHRYLDIEGQGWTAVDTRHDVPSVYPHNVVHVRTLPFDPDAVVAAAEQISAEFGIPWELSKYTLVTEVQTPRNLDQVKVRHPGCTVLAEGKAYSVGWDIADKWAVVRDTDGIVWAYWSDNGHGGGFDHWVSSDGQGSVRQPFGKASLSTFRAWAGSHEITPALPEEVL